MRHCGRMKGIVRAALLSAALAMAMVCGDQGPPGPPGPQGEPGPVGPRSVASVVIYLDNGPVAMGANNSFTVIGVGFEPGDVIYGELFTEGEPIAMVGSTATATGGFSATASLDLTRPTTLVPGVYTLFIRDTSGNNATAPLAISAAE